MQAKVLLISILIVSFCLSGCSSEETMAVDPGHRIVLQVAATPSEQWTTSVQDRASILEKTREVLQRRVASLPLGGEPSIAIEGTDRIVVDVPAGADKQEAVRLLTSVGSLEFYLLKNVLTPVNPKAKWKLQPPSQTAKSYIFSRTDGKLWLDSGKAAEMAKILSQVVGVPKTKPVLTGADLLRNAKAALSSRSNEPMIELEFNEHGRQVFADFTGKHVGEIVGVFYDGRLLTAPRINEKITGGKAEISGFASLKDAAQISDVLNSGALPVHLKVVPAANQP